METKVILVGLGREYMSTLGRSLSFRTTRVAPIPTGACNNTGACTYTLHTGCAPCVQTTPSSAGPSLLAPTEYLSSPASSSSSSVESSLSSSPPSAPAAAAPAPAPTPAPITMTAAGMAPPMAMLWAAANALPAATLPIPACIPAAMEPDSSSRVRCYFGLGGDLTYPQRTQRR